MPTDYTLSDLVKLSGVSPRTVRYYIAQGLLPAPTQSGPAARYSDAHLGRLRLIKKLQSSHLPLNEIRRQLEALPEEELAAAADDTPPAQPADSALDYIDTLLRRAPASPLPSMSAPPPAPAPPAAQPSALPVREPDRAQWERISLGPDVELHVRRPLTRQQNKRVERLISIARQLLEED